MENQPEVIPEDPLYGTPEMVKLIDGEFSGLAYRLNQQLENLKTITEGGLQFLSEKIEEGNIQNSLKAIGGVKELLNETTKNCLSLHKALEAAHHSETEGGGAGGSELFLPTPDADRVNSLMSGEQQTPRDIEHSDPEMVEILGQGEEYDDEFMNLRTTE